MSTTTEAPAVVVEIDETPMPIGHHSIRNRPTGHYVTVSVGTYHRTFVKIGSTWYTHCSRCDRYGTYTGFMHVMQGICFKCNGVGVGRKIGGEEEAIKRTVTAAKAATRAQAKRDAEAAAQRAKYDAWAAENAEIIAALAPYRSPVDYSETFERTSVTWLADRSEWDALTDEQVAEAVEKLARIKAREDAETARKAAQRFTGTVGEKITVTGRVAVAMTVDTQWGGSLLFIVEGEGEHEGVTVKWFTSAYPKGERGERVTITGTVKAHEHYGDTPQTVVTRAKVEVVS